MENELSQAFRGVARGMGEVIAWVLNHPATACALALVTTLLVGLATLSVLAAVAVVGLSAGAYGGRRVRELYVEVRDHDPEQAALEWWFRTPIEPVTIIPGEPIARELLGISPNKPLNDRVRARTREIEDAVHMLARSEIEPDEYERRVTHAVTAPVENGWMSGCYTLGTHPTLHCGHATGTYDIEELDGTHIATHCATCHGPEYKDPADCEHKRQAADPGDRCADCGEYNVTQAKLRESLAKLKAEKHRITETVVSRTAARPTRSW